MTLRAMLSNWPINIKVVSSVEQAFLLKGSAFNIYETASYIEIGFSFKAQHD